MLHPIAPDGPRHHKRHGGAAGSPHERVNRAPDRPEGNPGRQVQGQPGQQEGGCDQVNQDEYHRPPGTEVIDEEADLRNAEVLPQADRGRHRSSDHGEEEPPLRGSSPLGPRRR
jgi:hypothetical protein